MLPNPRRLRVDAPSRYVLSQRDWTLQADGESRRPGLSATVIEPPCTQALHLHRRPTLHTRPTPQQYRYYDFFMAAYVCIVLCANLIGAAKKSTVHLPLFGEVTFLAGVLFFPLSYMFGDILTEVYGYARDRRVVWAGFVALGFASLMASVIVALPPTADGAEQQRAVERTSSAARRASWPPRSSRSGAAHSSTAT